MREALVCRYSSRWRLKASHLAASSAPLGVLFSAYALKLIKEKKRKKVSKIKKTPIKLKNTFKEINKNKLKKYLIQKEESRLVWVCNLFALHET